MKAKPRFFRFLKKILLSLFACLSFSAFPQNEVLSGIANGNSDTASSDIEITPKQIEDLNSRIHFPKTSELINSHEELNSKWREIGPVTRPGGPGSIRMRGTGRLVFIEFDDLNHRIFTGSPLGGLWFSENEGQTWKTGGTDFLPEIGVSHIQIAPEINEGKTWFIATGDGDAAFNPSNGIWRTTDKGDSWFPINKGLDIGENFPPPFWSRCRKILIHPTNRNILFAAFRHGVYKTKNALESDPEKVIWERVADKEVMSEFFDLAFKPGSNGEVVIVTGNKVAFSSKNGEKGTFALIPNFECLTKRGGQLITLRVSPANPDIIYGAYESYVFSYSFRSQTAKTIRIGNRYKRSQAFAVSPFDGNEFIFGNVQGVYLSSDLGETMLKKPEKSFAYHDDIHFLIYRDSNEIWMANDGGICKSLDKGNTWEDLTTGIGAAVYYNIGISEKRPDLIIGGGWDTGPNIYFGRQDTFQTFRVFGDAFESIIDDSNPEEPFYYVSIQSGLVRFDNSLTKMAFSSQPNSTLKGKRNWTHEFVKDPNLQSTLYYSGMPAIARTKDRGVTWQNIIPNPQDENKARFFDGIWHSPSTSGFVYVLQNSKDPKDEEGLVIWKSENADAVNPKDVKWEKMIPKIWGFKGQISKDYSLTDLAIDPDNPHHIWICMSGYKEDIPKVMEYKGGRWKNASGRGLYGVNATRLIAQKNSDGLVYLGSHSGVYSKNQKTKEWSKIEGLPHAKVTDMEINNCAGLLRVATLGRGIWETDLVPPTEILKIEGSQIWDIDKVVSGTIVISEGAVLKISATLSFESSSKIRIEKGGKLILDAALLQSNCGLKWEGIWIQGIQSWPDTTTFKNQLEIINGSVIKDLSFN